MLELEGIYCFKKQIMALWEKLTALQWDAEITSEELTEVKLSELRQEIQDCSPEGTAECVQVIENAIPRAIGEAKTKLTSLRDSVKENSSSEYSLNAFIEKIEDEKAKKMIELYQMAIGRDLEKLYGAPFTALTPEAKETAKLVFWDILQSQIGIKGVMSIGKWKMEGIWDMFGSLFGSNEEGDPETKESVLTRHLRSEEGGIAILKSTVDSAFKEDIEQSIDIVESLIGDEANNMELLLEATNTLSESEKKQIYENPLLMREVLQNGRYTANGFDIDLKSKKATVGTEQDLKAVQSEFITKLSADSQWLGKTMDRMKSMADKTEKLMKDFDIGGFDEIKETLFNIPIIGIFFKMMFGDFFKQFDVLQNKDALERVINGLWDPEQRISLKSLEADFIPDFIKDEDSKDTPLGKLLREKSLSSDFYRSVDPFFATLKTKGVRYGEKDFWKKILTGKSAEGNEKTIYESLKSTLGKDDLSEESLIEALNGISAESLTQETEIPKVTPWDEVPDTPINPANTDTTVSPEESPAEGGIEPQEDEAPIIAPENVQKAALTWTVWAVVASQAGEHHPDIFSQQDVPGEETPASIENVPKVWVPLSEVTSLPATIIIPGIETPVEVGAFDPTTKQISIDGINYQFSDVFRDIETSGKPKPLKEIANIWIKDWSPFIQTVGGEPRVLKPEDIISVFTELMANEQYKITWIDTSMGVQIPYKIEIAQVT